MTLQPQRDEGWVMCVARSITSMDVYHTLCWNLVVNLDGGLFGNAEDFAVAGGLFGCSVSTTGVAGIDQVQACQDWNNIWSGMSDTCVDGPDCLMGVCMKFP